MCLKGLCSSYNIPLHGFLHVAYICTLYRHRVDICIIYQSYQLYISYSQAASKQFLTKDKLFQLNSKCTTPAQLVQYNQNSYEYMLHHHTHYHKTIYQKMPNCPNMRALLYYPHHMYAFILQVISHCICL